MVELKNYGFEKEKTEEYSGQILETNYPEPLQRLRIIHESPTDDLEKVYFWYLNFLRTELGLGDIQKIIDTFSASEQSSAFGAAQQRLAAQQQQVAQYLGTISTMMKGIFQTVNEIRKIKERLDLYDTSNGKKEGDKKASEIALKGIWVDMVQGGAQNPGSVIGLAGKPGFATLPDIFFRYNSNQIDSLDFGNEKTREMAKRMLAQYQVWKTNTNKELQVRHDMQIKYLRQMYSSIKIYLSWIKPYLRNIRKLHLNGKKLDSPDLISAFEGTMIEVEILATENGDKDIYPCLLINFDFSTKPIPHFREQQRGNIYVGRVEVNMRAYAWSKKEREKYIQMKNEEDLEIMGNIGGILTDTGELDPSASFAQSMDALSEDLKTYLIEAGEKFAEKEDEEEKKKKKPARPSVMDPFTSIIQGFAEIGTAFAGVRPKKEKKKKDTSSSKKKASKQILKQMAVMYKVFKKSNRMFAW